MAPGDARDPISKALRDWRIDPADLLSAEVVRESLDARKASRPVLKYTLELVTRRPYHRKMLEPITQVKADPDDGMTDSVPMSKQVHVVGTGPCGIAAAIGLAAKGFAVVLHERGEDVVERSRKARHLVKEGILDPETNFLYGEGGAGTFTDGKLTTRTRGKHVRAALKLWVDCGEEERIQWVAKPHLGTDRMRVLVTAMRKRFLDLGGEVRFKSRLEDIEVRDGRIVRARFSGLWIPCESLALAIGHSARDTLRMLVERGMSAERKDFALGARIEHPQELINRRQYGANGDPKSLGAAEYFLSCNELPQGIPGAYSFCMCPGGEILPTSTSADELATNGMSFRARAGRYANAGMVVPVRSEDLSAWCLESGVPDDMFAGMAFQQYLERRAAKMGGSGFRAPAQRASDFLEGRESLDLPGTSYSRGLTSVDLHDLFPAFVRERLAGSLVQFDRKIPGFIREGLFIAPETRTSCPLRFHRSTSTLECPTIQGVFPLGEGAGWAGGIVTSAADGLRFADRALLRG
ncbi:MAG: hypothetical protein RL318_523 [Fibrobacterota bacterium]|jgi:uncharacterized FAD-dependent dehydrogenase